MDLRGRRDDIHVVTYMKLGTTVRYRYLSVPEYGTDKSALMNL